jgi:acylphosphatase
VHRSVRIVVTGDVHGVGYRAFVERQARALGIAGWVRNRRDGTVEAVAVGPEEAVDTLIAACKRGPAAAGVKDVLVEDYTGTFLPGFMMLPTE